MKDPDFHIAFTVGKLTIYWYAILLALGIAVAMLISDLRAKKRAVPKDIALDLGILGVPFGVLGARLFACLSGAVSWNSFFDLSQAGFSYFGGIVAAAVAIVAYLKLRKISIGEMLDIAAPGVFAGIGIAVWGDFFNRTHYGPLVEKSSHKWFPLATFGSDLRIHYAAFFYEFLLCVLLIVIYYCLLRRMIQRKGSRFLVMVMAYLIGRFFIDSIRQDLVSVGSLAFDQICELILIVLCLFFLLLNRYSKGVNCETAILSETTEEPQVELTGASETFDTVTIENKTIASEHKSQKPFSGLD